jgi:HK97 family phage major capsid protein
MTLEEMKGQIRAKLLAARDIADASEKANRDMSDEERGQVQALMKEATELRAKFQTREQDDELRKSLSDLAGVGLMEPGSKDKRTPSGLIEADLSKKSMGQYFTESAVWNHFQQQNPNGRIGEKTRVQTDALGFKNMLRPRGRGAKALVTGASDTSAGAYIQDQWLGPISGLELFQRPLTIRDLVTNGTTSSDTVEYARVTAITNNAAPVAEATTAALPTQDGSTGPLINAAGGGYKPESSFTTERETAVVKTIAHWIPATKRALSDASQIMTLIDNFLEYGLEEELEDQMVSGSGSGENFEGIGTVSGTQSQAWDTDLFTTTRKAKTKVRLVGRARPNGYVLNPADVERLDLLQDNEGRYYFGGPGNAGTSADSGLWGLPVIESEAVPSGVGYVGDWTKAILWNRQQASISITDSHADFFVRNLVAILAEMRAAFGVIQPSAFVEIDLTA